jgi:hypothetical protein
MSLFDAQNNRLQRNVAVKRESKSSGFIPKDSKLPPPPEEGRY